MCRKVKNNPAHGGIIKKYINRCEFLHDIHCLYKGRGLKGENKCQPFPMGVYSEYKCSGRCKKYQPPDTSILFCLLHFKKFRQK